MPEIVFDEVMSSSPPGGEEDIEWLKELKLPFTDMGFGEGLLKQLRELEPFLLGFEHMLLLGVGGSALGARALRDAFLPEARFPGYEGRRLWIADVMDEAAFHRLLSGLPPARTLVVVVSKSGGTLETAAQYHLALDWMMRREPAAWRDHFLIVTDERSGFLRGEAERTGCRSLPVPAGLGGRYSVFSAVGLVPAMFIGMDHEAFFRGASGAAEEFRAAGPNSPLLRAAAWAAEKTPERPICVFFNWIPGWKTLNAWFSQLWAESLGKDGKGSTPVTAVGNTDMHSQLQLYLDGPADKICIYLTSARPQEAGKIAEPPVAEIGRPLAGCWDYLAGLRLSDILDAQCRAIRQTLERFSMPVLEMRAERLDEEEFGAVMWMLGMITILTGHRLGIDPLNQPAVEEGKRLTRAILRDRFKE